MSGGKGPKRADLTAESAESSIALFPLLCVILAVVTLPSFVKVKRTTQTDFLFIWEAWGVCQAAWMAERIVPWY